MSFGYVFGTFWVCPSYVLGILWVYSKYVLVIPENTNNQHVPFNFPSFVNIQEPPPSQAPRPAEPGRMAVDAVASSFFSSAHAAELPAAPLVAVRTMIVGGSRVQTVAGVGELCRPLAILYYSL